MQSAEKIRGALHRAVRVIQSRRDISDEVSDTDTEYAERLLGDPVLWEMMMVAEILEWVLEIESRPGDPNRVAQWLATGERIF
jgi:hypothetical protein